MPLSIDYRPKNLDEIVGNTSIVESLKAIFSREQDYPHAMLFQGASGCGKTTLARIVKDMLGCKGSDYVEINASNNRGIDTIRNIVENMKYRPMVKDSKCRVYLLDECHQVTGDAANALLKALEEPPKHVYFILCTTDPGKLLVTIKNRCTPFEVRSLSRTEMNQLLNWVLDCENVKDIPKDIIDQIIDFSDGCPRQSLVILDQIIDMPLDKMSEAVQDFRSADRNTADLVKGLLNKDSWDRIRTTLKRMDLSNPENVRLAVFGWMASEVMKGENPLAAIIADEFKSPFYSTGKNGIIMACYKIHILLGS